MIYILSAILIVIFDQVTKFLTVKNFPLGQTKEIIPKVLSFTYVKNEGAAFGILQGARVFFIILTVVILLLAIYYVIKMRPQSRLEKLSLAFIAGGAVGNFIDRAWLGFVRDFILLDFIDFPVFNIADCFVCIGAGLYILYAFLDMVSKKEDANE